MLELDVSVFSLICPSGGGSFAESPENELPVEWSEEKEALAAIHGECLRIEAANRIELMVADGRATLDIRVCTQYPNARPVIVVRQAFNCHLSLSCCMGLIMIRGLASSLTSVLHICLSIVLAPVQSCAVSRPSC